MPTAFDPSKLAEALKSMGASGESVANSFKSISNSAKSALSDVLNAKKAEQDRLNIAKKLGILIASDSKSIRESVSVSGRLLSSAKELASLGSQRINSQIKVNDLTNQMRGVMREISNAGGLQGARNTAAGRALLDRLNNLKQQKKTEESLLSNAQAQTTRLENQVKMLYRLNQLSLTLKSLWTDVRNIGVEFGSSIKTGLQTLSGYTEKIASKLNIPTSVEGSFAKIFEVVDNIDKAATSIRQKFGLLPLEGQEIERTVRKLTLQLADYGITSEQIGSTTKEIGSNFTRLQAIDQQLIADVSILNAQFGVSAKTSAEFLKTMGGVRGQSTKSQIEMIKFAKSVSNAYGVGLDDVMSDVANASDDARIFAGKNADEMVRAAAQARQMGTSLDNMARTAKGLLNFETSIQAELKASALIGRNINFNEARRLAFQGKVVEANKLILDQAKKIKFNQLNPIAQEAFAQAAGKSVKELQDMLNAEENLKEALKSNDITVRSTAEEMKKKADLAKNDPIAAKKAAQEEYNRGIIQQRNQTRMAQLQNQINAIFLELVEPILKPMVAALNEAINYLKENKNEAKQFVKEIGNLYMQFKLIGIAAGTVFKPLGLYISKTGTIIRMWTDIGAIIVETGGYIGVLVSKIGGLFTGFSKITGAISGITSFAKFIPGVGSSIAGISTALTSISNVGSKIFTTIGPIISKIFTFAASTVSVIGKTLGYSINGLGKTIGFLGKLGPIFGAVAKFLGPIGIVISVIQGLISFIDGFAKASGTFGQKVAAGLKNVFQTLIVEPLKMAWNFIKNIPDFIADIDLAGIYKDLTDGLLSMIEKIPDFIESLFSPTGGKGANWKGMFTQLGKLLLNMIVFEFVKLPYTISKVILLSINAIIKGLTGLDVAAKLKEWFDIGKQMYQSIVNFPSWLKKTMMEAFENVYTLIKTKFAIGKLILQGILSSVENITQSLISPFKTAWNSISDWLGFSPSVLGKSIVNGIKSVVDDVFEALTYPFKKGFQIIKSAISEVSGLFKSAFDGAFEFVTYALEKIWERLKGVGGLISDIISKGASIAGKILGISTETVEGTKNVDKAENDMIVTAIINSNKIIADKLDKLTQLMTSGQIAVYIDGQRANQLLAASVNKFGSFGQATTT